MADTTKLVELLGEDERLRLEHNAAGKEYREGRLKEVDWETFKSAWLTRSEDVCRRLNAEIAAQGVTLAHSATDCKAYAGVPDAKAVPILTVSKADMLAVYEAALAVQPPK